MDAKEIIKAILEFENITPAQLAKDIGLSRPQVIYDILNGKVKSITKKMADKIKSAKPAYRMDFLLTGNGDMIDADFSQNEQKKTVYHPEPMDVINKLVEENAKKDEELKQIREYLQHLTKCFEILAEKANLPISYIEKEAM